MKITWEESDKDVSKEVRDRIREIAVSALILYHMGGRDLADSILKKGGK